MSGSVKKQSTTDERFARVSRDRIRDPKSNKQRRAHDKRDFTRAVHTAMRAG